MREQSNTFNAHLLQKQTAGLPARKAVQRIFWVMALVRGASMSKTTGMRRGIPLLGIMLTKRLKSIALRITSMPVASAPFFSEQDRKPQPIPPISRDFDGLLVSRAVSYVMQKRGFRSELLQFALVVLEYCLRGSLKIKGHD